MNWLLLVLLIPSIALAADDAPRMAHIVPSTIQTPSGPQVVIEGCYLRVDVCMAVATGVEQDQKQKEALAERVADSQQSGFGTLTLVGAFMLGLVVGIALAH